MESACALLDAAATRSAGSTYVLTGRAGLGSWLRLEQKHVGYNVQIYALTESGTTIDDNDVVAGAVAAPPSSPACTPIASR